MPGVMHRARGLWAPSWVLTSLGPWGSPSAGPLHALSSQSLPRPTAPCALGQEPESGRNTIRRACKALKGVLEI